MQAMRLPAIWRKLRFPLLIALALDLEISAETISVSPAADTSIFSFNPGNNLGGLSNVPLGPINRDADAQGFFQQGRMLVRYDLSAQLPPGAQITGVRLRLSVVKESSGGAPLTVDLHRLLVPWAEGSAAGSSSGTAATSGQSSWQDRIKGTAAWSSPGAKAGTDYNTTFSGSTVVDNAGTYTVASTPELIADVQAWIADPASNQGWILLPRAPMIKGSAKRIFTREGGNGATLELTYTLPPPPELRLDAKRIADGRIELHFHGEPGNIYEIQFASDPVVPVWQPLTNFIVKLQPAEPLATDVTDLDHRFYRVAITGHVD